MNGITGKLSTTPRFLLGSGIALALTVLGIVLWQAMGVIVPATTAAVPDPEYPSSGASYPHALTVKEMVNKAEITFIGRVTSVGGLINGARLQSDPSKPDPNVFSAARQYVVDVVTDLTGSTPAQVVLVQNEGGFNAHKRTLEEWLEIRHQMVYPKFRPLEVGRTYTFMLKRLDWNSSLWVGATEPYRFKHVSDGRAFPEGTYSDAGQYIDIPTQEALKSNIEDMLASTLE